MSRGHTPGPWQLYEGHESVGGFIDDAAGNALANCFAGDRSPEEVEANTFLVAAAPDLLAACKEVLRRASPSLSPDLRGMIQVAIARAESRADG